MLLFLVCSKRGRSSPLPCDALNASYRYLELKRLGCDTYQRARSILFRSTEDDTGPRTGTILAVRTLFRTARSWPLLLPP